MDTTNKLAVGGRYNWKGQPERLVYIGRNWSGNGYWHQFELVGRPGVVWCEVVDADLGQFEESPADAAQATQAVSEPVAMQPAEAVAEFKNGSWRLRIGSVYMTAPNPPAGPWMVNEEHQAKMYAARINAEIAGGVAAFGCDVEASGDSARGRNGKRCQSWCGLAKCAMSLRAAIVAHPSPASASEPANVIPSGMRRVPFMMSAPTAYGLHYVLCPDAPTLTACGLAIKTAAGRPANYQLYLEMPGEVPDRAIADSEAVVLASDGSTRFRTTPPASY